MNFTLHLTDSCNMDCAYCTREKSSASMSYETVKAACEMAFATGKNAGFCFFGGEPLLERDKIYYALDICLELSKKTGKPFSCKMTTNGTLLDEEFIARAKEVNMGIGLSFDGLAQSVSRHFKDGSDTLPLLEEKAKMLLSQMPASYAMLTLDPKAVKLFEESVEYLYNLGFRRITATPAYGYRVRWDDESFALLEQELMKIADFYEEVYRRGERFFFSPFDSKICDSLRGSNPSERCHLGMRQMPVAPDGKIYACTQFIGDEDYCFGDVYTGIDPVKCAEMAKRASEPIECRECALRERCTNSCGCMNRLETGDENRVSPLQCAYERTLIRLSDNLADRLIDLGEERFLKRFLNN